MVRANPVPSTRSLKFHRIFWAYVFLAVPMAFFLYIRIWPALQAFDLSLREWNILSEARPYVGFENYAWLAGDERFRRALINTALYTIAGVPSQLVLGLTIAFLLNGITRLRGFFRGLYFMPYVVPVVAAAWAWQWLYSPNFGALNKVLGIFGIPPQGFLSDPSQALYAVTAVVVWQQLGFQIVLFLAGLQSIPLELYEAASIDGAGRWTLFRRITLPLLNPTIVFSVVMGTISYLQLFTQVVNLNFADQGGPLNSTLSVALYIYQVAFQRFTMGRAAAITVVLFIIIMTVTLIQMKLVSRRVEY